MRGGRTPQVRTVMAQSIPARGAALVPSYLMAAALSLFAGPRVLAEPKFAWPLGRHAAITLTYDDAIATSHPGVAIPQLDHAGLLGTFFLMGKAIRTDD